jgi:hypothetical protein
VGRLEDPYLWERAHPGAGRRPLDANRRAPDIQTRVCRGFQSGVRGGIVTTPTLIVTGARYAGRIDAQVLEEVNVDVR